MYPKLIRVITPFGTRVSGSSPAESADGPTDSRLVDESFVDVVVKFPAHETVGVDVVLRAE